MKLNKNVTFVLCVGGATWEWSQIWPQFSGQWPGLPNGKILC